MKRIWTIIGVRDVPASFRWYQSLLGLVETAPAHDYFGQILDADGTVLLCLHQWGAHEHPSLTSPEAATPGNGLLLFFRVDDFDEALTRARALVSRRNGPRGGPAPRQARGALSQSKGASGTERAANGQRVGLRGGAPTDSGFEEEPHTNPNTRTSEFSLRDPDGYYVTVSALAET